MLGLQDDPGPAFGVAAIHTAVRTSREAFEANAEFAPDELAHKVFEIGRREVSKPVRHSSALCRSGWRPHARPRFR